VLRRVMDSGSFPNGIGGHHTICPKSYARADFDHVAVYPA
jgi:hypothetical protein